MHSQIITTAMLVLLIVSGCAQAPQQAATPEPQRQPHQITEQSSEESLKNQAKQKLITETDLLVSRLGSEVFKEREEAQSKLQDMILQETGLFETLIIRLKEKQAGAKDTEVKIRLERILNSYVKVLSLYRDAELVALVEVGGYFHEDLWSEGVAVFGNVFQILVFLKGESPLQIGLVDEEWAQGVVDDENKKIFYRLPETKDNLYILFIKDTKGNLRAEGKITAIAPTTANMYTVDAICKLFKPSLRPFTAVPEAVRDKEEDEEFILPDTSKDKEKIERFMKLLEDEKPNARLHAARALGRFKSPKIVEPLVKALDDSNPWVRLTAAYSIEKAGRISWEATLDLGDKEKERLSFEEKREALAVKPLLRLLSDENPNLRWAAAQTLGASGDTQTAEPLIKALHDANPNVRLAAAIALNRTEEDKKIIGPLIAALNDKSAHVRGAIVRIFMDKHNPRTIEPLCKMLKDSETHIRYNAVWALSNFTDTDTRIMEPLIKTLKDSDKDVRCSAAYVLGYFKDTKAVDGLITLLNDTERNVRAQAATSLGEIASPKAVEELTKALNDEDWLIRREAATALGKIGDARAVEPLLKLENDTCLEVGAIAIKSLGQIGGAEAVKALIKVVEDISSKLRDSAVEALGITGDPGAVDILVKMIKTQGSHLCEPAISALGKIDDDKALETLVKLLVDDNKDMRYAAACSLCESKSKMVVEPLIKALADKNPNMRRVVSKALGNIGDTKAVKPLIGLLSDETEIKNWTPKSSVNTFVANALVKIGTPALLILKEALKEEKDGIVAGRLQEIIIRIEKNKAEKEQNNK
jgi:HEAT repeat protein